MNKYIVKFYDGWSMVDNQYIEARTLKSAINIALKAVTGLKSFDKIKIKKLYEGR